MAMPRWKVRGGTNWADMSDTEKQQADWERIESEYRAGILSLREIAARQGITEGAIRKKAKRLGWPRDLQRKIQQRATDLDERQQALLAREKEGKPLPATLADLREAEIIEVAARNVAVVRMKHREDIDRLRQLARALVIELQLMTGERQMLSDLAHKLAADKVISGDQVRALEKALSATGRSTLLQRLAETTKTIVALEREAYGMDAIPLGKDGDPEDGGNQPVRVVVEVVDAGRPESFYEEAEADEDD